jgi:DNA polymerase III subunit epsilon
MDLLAAPIATAEFMVVDTETNGLAGDDCELTEVGAVLVGGGELHDRWSSLCRTSAPLRRGIQRLTGITQAMVDGAPSLEDVLPKVSELLQGRVLVAHNAPFDRRVLRQAFGRIGLEWPDPPVMCTAAMARTMLPLQRRRGLGVLADALGIDVHTVHRALADAETCARVLCALFPRLCANAATIGDALAMLTPRRRPRKRPQTRSLPPNLLAPAPGGPARLGGAGLGPARGAPEPDFADLPRDPGVYLFRDDAGRVLYVGKSVSIRSRARAHFAPSSPPAAWTRHATVVDYRTTGSELGALIVENRLIKELKPPGNTRLTRRDDRLVYIRCRLDIPFPILEVAAEPAAGHAVTVGPVRGRRLALELVEQLDSLFGLRHCGRRLPRREHPSAYGQMGRCLSPCLGDLDPNLYRRRLDEVLALFVSGVGGAGISDQPLLRHVYGQMRAAAAQERFERAESLRRRAGRLRTILDRLGGVLEATHARPRLLLAPHPEPDPAHPPEAFWLVGGRLVDFGPLAGAAQDAGGQGARGQGAVDDLAARTQTALRRDGRVGEVGAHVPPDEIDEVRIIGTWLASHPETPQLVLRPAPDRQALRELLQNARAARSGAEGELDDDRLHLVGADHDL